MILQIKVIHRVDIDVIVEVNSKLRDFQRAKLERTPFKWLVRMTQPINISCPLLRELVSRWSPNDQSFRIREFLVPLSSLDVCMGLGLGITGQEVSFNDNNLGLVNNLFNGEDITVVSIVEKLNDKKLNSKKNVDDFCRLYILLAFVVFYFPRTTRTVCTFLFYLLDSLEDLHLYNWGGAVLSMLSSSLDRCSYNFHHQKNLQGMYLCSCVPVLQVNVLLLKFIFSLIYYFIDAPFLY